MSNAVIAGLFSLLGALIVGAFSILTRFDARKAAIDELEILKRVSEQGLSDEVNRRLVEMVGDRVRRLHQSYEMRYQNLGFQIGLVGMVVWYVSWIVSDGDGAIGPGQRLMALLPLVGQLGAIAAGFGFMLFALAVVVPAVVSGVRILLHWHRARHTADEDRPAARAASEDTDRSRAERSEAP